MRKYKRKSNRASVSLDTMNKAAHLVLKKKFTIRAAAHFYRVCNVSLTRFLERLKTRAPTESLLGYVSPRQVFTKEQEKLFVDKLRHQSKLHSFSSWEIRIKALQFAVSHHIKVPPSWEEKWMAGEDWLSGFYKRNDFQLWDFLPARRQKYFNRLKKEGKNIDDLLKKYEQIDYAPRRRDRMYYLYVGEYESMFLEANDDKTDKNGSEIVNKLNEETNTMSEQSELGLSDNFSGIIRVLDKAISFYRIEDNEENFYEDKFINVFVYMPRTQLLVYLQTLDSGMNKIVPLS